MVRRRKIALLFFLRGRVQGKPTRFHTQSNSNRVVVPCENFLHSVSCFRGLFRVVGGLQVQDANGDWIQAPPIEGTLIVNVADLLSRWTDGAYKSTPHRVVNSSGQKRLSIVLAFDPNPETVIDAKEVFGQTYKPKETATTCGEYLTWRFEKAFAYRKKTK